MATVVFTVGLVVFGAWLAVPNKTEHGDDTGTSAGYVVECKVSHRRLRPKRSSHSFTYPTLWLFASLTALESRSLDLSRGWVFGYGRRFLRLTGLRSAAYLNDTTDSLRQRGIRDKLDDILRVHGYNLCRLKDAWMMTMPSFLGFEGINPLTIYYCYSSECELFVIVLEVHNTFGERHLYFLDVGKTDNDDGHDPTALGTRLRWVIPRDFHVSPFNDRLGEYVITVSVPSHPPPAVTSQARNTFPCPAPFISIHLRESSHLQRLPSSVKMTATLCTTDSKPLTTSNVLHALLRQPLALLLSFLRILYQAWVLHYIKRLNVYVRPEPKPARDGWSGGNIVTFDNVAHLATGRGIGWQSDGWLEKHARARMGAFLARRAEETGSRITLTSGNSDEPDLLFAPTSSIDIKWDLTIWYLSSSFFTAVFLAPSIEHALLLGYYAEQIFIPSSITLFSSIFCLDPIQNFSSPKVTSRHHSLTQILRASMLPTELLTHGNTVPFTHPLDPTFSERWNCVQNHGHILSYLAYAYVVRWLYWLIRARFMQGQEPWQRWNRVLEMLAANGRGPTRISC